MDPYSTCFLKRNKLYFSFGASCPKVLVTFMAYFNGWVVRTGVILQLV